MSPGAPAKALAAASAFLGVPRPRAQPLVPEGAVARAPWHVFSLMGVMMTRALVETIDDVAATSSTAA